MTYRYRVMLVACAISVGLFFYEGLLGFNLADEGYLWYGAQQTVAGFIPGRDFMAYEPGRYYWAAAVMLLRGDAGVNSLWISTAILQGISFFLALIALRSALEKSSLAFIFLIAAVFAAWMIPRHKTFDIAASILLMTTLVWLIEHPDRKRFFITGLALGVAALIGRNHFLYGLVGQAGAVIFLHFGGPPLLNRLRLLFCWLSGLSIGLLPYIGLMFLARGYGAALVDSSRFIAHLFVKTGSTNLALPIPWPWLVEFQPGQWISSLRAILLGVIFLCLTLFCVLGYLVAMRQRLRGRAYSPVLVAAVCLAPPYAHHAFSRAEILHLAQSLFPLLIGLAAWLTARKPVERWVLGCAALLISLFVTCTAHPGYQSFRDAGWRKVRIGNDIVVTHSAATLEILQTIINRLTTLNETFLAVPYWPGAYAVAGRTAPLWEIYALLSRDADFETKELQRIRSAQPRFAFVQDIPLEGREELRYSRTHPLIYQYITTHYKKVGAAFPDKTIDLYVQPDATYP